MNLEQCVQGLMYCILDQTDNRIRENMILYFTLVMQDAIKLSPNTARRVHAAVLQEMERGKVSWSQIDLVEKNQVYLSLWFLTCLGMLTSL